MDLESDWVVIVVGFGMILLILGAGAAGLGSQYTKQKILGERFYCEQVSFTAGAPGRRCWEIIPGQIEN